LQVEKQLTEGYPTDLRYAYEDRNGKVVRQYSNAYTSAYHLRLAGMVERRMRQSIFSVSSFWYTAWVNAGQPDLRDLGFVSFQASDLAAWDSLNLQWKADRIMGRGCE
jgi:hypothetical protein